MVLAPAFAKLLTHLEIVSENYFLKVILKNIYY